jgi:hypothetical protein
MTLKVGKNVEQDWTCSRTGYTSLTGLHDLSDWLGSLNIFLKFVFFRSLFESLWVLSTLILKDQRRQLEGGGGEKEPIKNSSWELAICPKIDPTHISSN